MLLSLAAVLSLTFFLYRLRFRHAVDRLQAGFQQRLDERTRIARELHDTLLQSFQGLSMKLYELTFMIRDCPAEAQKALDTIIEQAGQAMTEGRYAVLGLRSSTVIRNDLGQAISGFAKNLIHHADRSPEFRLLVEGESRDLPPLVRDEIYRIACEALRNAFQHAQAGRIEVEIHYAERQLRLHVRDNGKGIEAKLLGGDARAGHYGLAGMQERAKRLGGTLAVFTRPGSGTDIGLTIPASLACPKKPVVRRSIFSRKHHSQA